MTDTTMTTFAEVCGLLREGERLVVEMGDSPGFFFIGVIHSRYFKKTVFDSDKGPDAALEAVRDWLRAREAGDHG